MPIFIDTSGKMWVIPERAMVPVLADKPTPAPDPDSIDDMSLTVSGNIIMHGQDPWYASGPNIFDTRGCNACAYDDPDVDEIKRRMSFFALEGATLFRLCLESYATADGRVNYDFDDPRYLDDVAEIVAHARTLGCWVLVAPWNDSSLAEDGMPTGVTIGRLAQLADRFVGTDHVIIGCCNEPQRNWDNSDTARRFAAFTQCVTAIRERGFTGLVAVQGLSGWGRDLTPYVDMRLNDGQVIYETHIYGPPVHYDRQVLDVSSVLPVIIGEYGPMVGLMTTDDCAEVATAAYDDSVPNIAWAGHHRCNHEQAMLADYSEGGCGIGMSLELTDWGEQCAAHWRRVDT
jgi:hypothetical protein